MESTIKTTHAAYSHAAAKTSSESAYDRFLAKLKFSYFGIISMTITVGSILGGLAAMAVFQNGAPIWEVAVIMALAMANNVACIGQAPIKWVVNLFLASSVASIFFIIINSI